MPIEMPFGQALQKLKHRVKACFVFVVMLMIAGNAYAYEICRSGSKINVECTEREFSDWSGTCQAFGWVSADYEIKHLASADYADMEGECAGFVEGRSPILLAKKPYYLICKMSDLYIERPYNESLDSDATGHIVNYRWGTFEFSVVGSCAYATDAHGTAAGALSASRGRYCPQGFVDRGYDDGFAPCWRPMVYEDHSCPVGNPTLPGQGVKTHTETLITANGITSLPLNLTYRSKYSGDTRLPNGAWLHSYQHMVHHKPNGAYVYISRPDGRVFRYDEKSTDLVWVSTETSDKLTETSSGWQLNVLENDSIETYDLSGRLQSIRQRNGSTTTLHYNAQQQLTTVTAPLGRTLDFAYNSAGQLASVRASSSELTQLGYDTAGNLSTLTRSDGRARYFHYENATYEHALTGITDETGQRIGTYAYNADGRVFETQRALGVDHYQFFYGSDTQGLPLTYVVNLSSGQPQQRTYNFNVQDRVLRPSVIGVPYGQSETPQETQYDDQGHKIREISHDGRVTFYTRNAKGRITREATYPASLQSATTAPPLNQAERVTSTQWHGMWNLPLKVAEAYLITSYSYDGKGNLLELIKTPTTDATGAKGFNAVPSGETKTTQWTYDTRNLPSTIVEQSAGVETGRWALSYNSTGDVTRIDNLTTGTFTTMSQYDGQGRMLEGVAEGGIPVSVTYDARGHVTSITREGKRKTFVYDARGLFTQANFPTGDVITLTYDSNGQFIEAFQNGVAISTTLLTSQRSAPSPTFFARPFYGKDTSSCAYYSQACGKNGGYACYAQYICPKFPEGEENDWWQCVRQCLQEEYKRREDSSGNFCPVTDNPYEDHKYCFVACAINSGNPGKLPGTPPRP